MPKYKEYFTFAPFITWKERLRESGDHRKRGSRRDSATSLSRRWPDFAPRGSLSFILLVLTPLLPPLLQCLKGATTLTAYYFSETLSLADTLNLLSI